ncbi:hypothetical protein SBRCBS47491_001899 [Sporothrix bragantina]|uniref:FAM192A/Fyv6 N-terminal domain-containing protein n=1 Tax=Sporothrix bragantina TaxID=671064 RepID=A0ABP0B2F3_9PEZI
MSSRFVSGGAIDAATGAAIELKPKAAESAPTSTQKTTDAAPSKPSLLVRKHAVQAAPEEPNKEAPAEAAEAPMTTARQAEWAAVEKQLEAERQRRAEARKALHSGAGGETSLYDALQANKAAKQAAFEEQHKLKNQFRALDEDEIEFLDGLEADARAAEAQRRAEMAAGLDAFRAAQGGGGGGGAKKESGGGGDDDDVHDDGSGLFGDTAWAVGRKRKRRADNKTTAFPNLKRKGSTADKEDKVDKAEKAEKAEKETPQKEVETKAEAATAPPPKAPPKTKAALGLGDYGSDDDDSG